MDSTLLIVIGIIAAVIVVVVLVLVMRARKRREADQRREEREARRAERARARQAAREQAELDAQKAEEEAQFDAAPLPVLVDDDLMDEPPSLSDGGFFEYVSETSYTTIDAPEPCGFDFRNVVAGFRPKGRQAAADEGAGGAVKCGREPLTVYAQGANFEKVKADIQPMMPLFEALSAPRAELVYKAVFPDLPRMLSQVRPFGEREGTVKGIENVPVITVVDDDSARRAGALPVKVRIVMLNQDVRLEKRSNSALRAAQAASSVPSPGGVDHGMPNQDRPDMPDSLVLDMFYEPEGLAVQGRVVAWRNKNGYLCEFALGRVSGEYIPTSLSVTNRPGTWRTVF